MIFPGEPRIRGYVALAAHLRKRIQDGEFQPGQRLPAEPDLMATYGLAEKTVRRAVHVLRDEGIAEHVPGWGTVVKEPREVERIRLEPGSRVRARPATLEERGRYGEGVAMLQVFYRDGAGDAYPGDRTEFYTDPDE